MAFIHNPKIVTDGLVAYYDTADLVSYSGSVHGGTLANWNNLGSNGTNGTIYGAVLDEGNAASGSTSLFRRSLKFDKSNDYVDTGISFNDFAGSDDFTLALWIKSDGTHNTDNDKYFFGVLSGAPDFYWRWHGDDIRVEGTSLDYQMTDNNLVANTWYYFAVVKEGSKQYGYNNGNLHVTSSESNTWNNSNSLHIGSLNGYSSYFGGNINCVSMYNRALSADEILENYTIQRKRFGV